MGGCCLPVMVDEGCIQRVVYFYSSWFVVVSKNRTVCRDREHHSAGVYVIDDLLRYWRGKKVFRAGGNGHLHIDVRTGCGQ